MCGRGQAFCGYGHGWTFLRAVVEKARKAGTMIQYEAPSSMTLRLP